MKKMPCLVFSILMLAGCAADPAVRPVWIRGQQAEPPPRQFTTYALQRSKALLTLTTTGEGANARKVISAAFQREEQPDVRIALEASDSWGRRTDITVTRYDNTDIPQSIQIKTADNRAALINQAGGFLAQLVTAVVSFSEETLPDPLQDRDLPLTVNLSADIGSARPEAFVFSGPKYHTSYGPVAPDAVRADTAPMNQSGPYLYFAACRDATVEIVYNGETKQFRFRVADPFYLQRVRMPYEGTITMHTQCGVNTSGVARGDDVGSAIAISSAILTQLQAIRKAAESGD
jgi:hypothetical protein